MIIDTHAHLIYEKMETDKIIQNMEQDGLEKILTIGVDAKDSVLGQKLAEENRNIYSVVGIHPECASDISENDLEIIDNLAQKNKVVAIGEIGLDYHYRADNIKEQKELFVKQIKLAYKHGLPICIHSRDAAEDMYEILSKYAQRLKRKGVMHCYSDGSSFAKKYTELGFYISFAGNVTFKNYDRSFLKDIPTEKIIVETDCPFLAPEPLRGTTNEPKNVRIIAAFLAKEYELLPKDFESLTLENTKKVYYKIK